ncbi:MAG: response regulator, partial [Campylobacterales bacterium]|nr:response regulator [Campylobacterales bacterium]
MANDKDTILVVDDNPINVELLASVLESDYNVITAYGGEEALDLLKKPDKPDMILLDIMMPHIDGYDVIKILKSSKETKDIPVIFITAMHDTGDETKGFMLGAADYIIKPINMPIVEARVKTHLTISKQKRELEKQNFELQKVVRILEKKLSNASHSNVGINKENIESLVNKNDLIN